MKTISMLVMLCASLSMIGCATNIDGTTTIGQIESHAWFNNASQKTIEAHYDAMEAHQLCIRWAETKNTRVRNEISNSLKRRGMNPLFCY